MPIFQDPDFDARTAWLAEPGSDEDEDDDEEDDDDDDDDDDDAVPTRRLPGTTTLKGNALWDIEMDDTSTVNCEMENYSPTKVQQTSDRGELIECIKRGETPAWVPNRSLGEYVTGNGCSSPSWVPGLQRKETNEETRSPDDQQPLASASEIERPRSALHSGDFREGSPHATDLEQSHAIFFSPSDHPVFNQFGSSPTTPWYNPSFPAPFRIEKDAVSTTDPNVGPFSRSHAPWSGSFASSYVLKPPTSPLVYQANNTDLDFSPMTDRMDVSPIVSKNATRRRTLPPETFRQLQTSPPIPYNGINFSRPYPPGRRDESFPYRAHQSRRSLTSSYSLQLASSPQSPCRSRRTSFAADMSPLLHAPMVGSYEESILRGRMSTTPSKPLNFTAQIGVLGKGNCKPNLRCPPHVTIPFPAVFYSYPSSGSDRSIADDSPSPYVGMIDLENSLPSDASHDGRRRRHTSSPTADQVEHSSGEYRHHPTKSGRKNERRGREKRSARPESLKTPPGRCYRIPQQGQLQIVIKNPNKTAVKLFLVPYDLGDMEPGTKTFIRQRCYSTGPIIDMPLTAKQNLMGTDPSADVLTDPTDKPILRYLIHVNICSPSKGRFYLYSSIRVVFANRVPDGKEKLRNEIQHPDPRYSPYKPAREIPFSPASARSVVEKALRRRSLGMGLVGGQMIADGITRLPSPYLRPVSLQLSTSSNEQTPMSGDDVYRERGYPWLWKPSQSSFDSFDVSRLDTSRRSSSPCINSPESNTELYQKLSKGDVGYGGYPFGPLSGGSEVGESLLAKRLRGLDVKIQRAP
ncbi:hypothetical protein V8E54_000254 [Elaphomyces granulatus]